MAGSSEPKSARRDSWRRTFGRTLAGRLHLLLLAVAPLPLVALWLLSTYQYEAKLRSEAEVRLAAQAKDAGLEAYRRLLDLEADLRRVAGEDAELTPERWSGRFRSVVRLAAGQAPSGILRDAGGAASAWAERQGGDRASLVETEGGKARPALWLAVPTGRDGSALWGEIELDWFWTTGELPPEGGIRWVLLGARGNEAIAFAPGPAPDLESRLRKVVHQGIGGFEWRDDRGTAWRARFATIPLGHRFGHPGLVVAVGEVDRLAHEAALLRRTSWLVALGGLALAGLLILRNLAWQLRPLATLLEGTRRLAAGELSARIEIAGPADLEQLGRGFNQMAEQLDRSFHLLEAGNEVALEALGAAPDAESVASVFVKKISAVAPPGIEVVIVLADRGGASYLIRRDSPRGRRDGRVPLEPSSPIPTVVVEGSGWVELERGFVPLASGRSGIPSAWRAIWREDRLLGAVGVLGLTGQGAERDFLAALDGPTAQLGVAISRLRLIDDLERANWGALTALARAVDAKSPWTRGHSERVTGISVAIGEQLELSPKEQRTLRRGALLHDVGKIGVPGAVLDKSETLTADEVELLRSHVEKGVRILEPMEGFNDVLPIVAQHHERLDGSGYPRGLRGAEIDRLAALVAVADVFEALSASRPYRPARDPERGMAYLRQGAGEVFDRDCVAALERARRDVERWPYPELAPTAARSSAAPPPRPSLDATMAGTGSLRPAAGTPTAPSRDPDEGR